MTSTGPIGEAEVLATDTADLFRAATRRAAELLRADEVVALPTETVYGLAANARSRKAVLKIYEVKGRPRHNPLIVHVSSVEMARACVSAWSERAEKLARTFWPGPLTMVLPKSPLVSGEVTADGPTVAIRFPAHPFMRGVIEACGFPVAAPSANRSNELSPTTAAHVLKSLGTRITLIVDGGRCQVGIESTVVDLRSEPPRILRPGAIAASAIGAAAWDGEPARPHGRDGPALPVLESPGLLARHYSPKAKLVIARWENSGDLERRVAREHPGASRVCVIAREVIPSVEHFARVSVIPNDPEAFARALYAELHACDEAGADLIVAEEPPGTEPWAGIVDRLRRASGSESLTGRAN
jgi:L-threonylcarbamoyladenylate synthase